MFQPDFAPLQQSLSPLCSQTRGGHQSQLTISRLQSPLPHTPKLSLKPLLLKSHRLAFESGPLRARVISLLLHPYPLHHISTKEYVEERQDSARPSS